MQAKECSEKPVDILSVGSGVGHEGYKGQTKEAKRRKVFTAIQAKERCQLINATLTADKVSCKLDSKGEALILRFTAPLREATDKPTHAGGSTKQYTLGCGLSATDEGFNKATLYARQISQQLKLKLFTWEWYDSEIKGIEPTLSKPVAVRLCSEMIEELKSHYFAESRRNKNPEANWKSHYWEDLKEFKPDEQLSESAIKRVIQTTEANTYSRHRCVRVIRYFLEHFNLLQEYEPLLKKFKSSTEYEQSALTLLSDEEIEKFVLSLVPGRYTQKQHYETIACWQWTFGMIATYGLRPHESMRILNLFESYEYHGKQIPALNDPANDRNLIVTTGKTGMRLAMPLSPEGKDWIKLFNLKDPKPRTNFPKDETKIGVPFQHFLVNRGYEFKTYSLRHSFNHRCRVRGIDTSTAAMTLGHSEEMNSTTYKRQLRGDTVATILENSLTKLELKDVENHTVETLKTENELLRAHNLQLEAKVAELERRLAILALEA